MGTRLEYNSKDSSIVFLMSLIAPLLIGSVAVMLLKGFFPAIDDTTYYYVALSINQLVFLGCFLVYNKITKTNIKSACRVKFNLNILQIIIVIAIGLVAMYGFSSLVDYMGYVLSQLGYTSTSFSFLNLSNFGMFLLSVFVVAVMPAFCEESLFRGIALNGLRKKGEWTAIVISGLMFCIMHLSIEQSIYQFVLGMVLSSVVVITGSILSSMILHFFNNFYILLLSFIAQGSTTETPVTTTYTTVIDHILPFLLAIVSVIIIYLLLVLLKKCTKNCECKAFSFENWSKNDKKTNIDSIVPQQDNNLENSQNSLTKNCQEIEKNQVVTIVDENSSQNSSDSNAKLLNEEKQSDVEQNALTIQNESVNQTNTQKKPDLFLILSLLFGAFLWIVMVVAQFFVN